MGLQSLFFLYLIENSYWYLELVQLHEQNYKLLFDYLIGVHQQQYANLRHKVGILRGEPRPGLLCISSQHYV